MRKGISNILLAAVTAAAVLATAASGHPGHAVGRGSHHHGAAIRGDSRHRGHAIGRDWRHRGHAIGRDWRHRGHAIGRDWRHHGHGHAYGHSNGRLHGNDDSQGDSHGNGHHYGWSNSHGHHKHDGGSSDSGGESRSQHGNGHAYGHPKHGVGHGYGHKHASTHNNARFPSHSSGTLKRGGASAPRIASIVSAGSPARLLSAGRGRGAPGRTFGTQPVAAGTDAVGTPLNPDTALLGFGGTTAAAGRAPRLFGVPLRPGLGAGRSAFAQPAAHSSAQATGTGTKGSAGGRGSDAATGGTPLPVKPTLQQPSVIQRIERVIPGFVWLAIGASLLFAAVGGAAAVWSGRRVRRQAGQFAAVSAAAMTDPLTGVLNRRGFTEAAERELARAQRYDRPFVVAYIDVRGLKTVNDTEGHLAGDALLKEAAEVLRTSARADDVVGRIGGDEMALLLAEQTATSAIPVVDRINSQVAVRRAEMGLRARWDLTIGTAAYPEDGETVSELLGAADRRLYEQRGIAL